MSAMGRIVVVDRSGLAGNIYRLLLEPIGASLVICRRLEDVPPALRRGGAADLAIMNTNALGASAEAAALRIGSEPALARARKVLLVKEGAAGRRWRRAAEAIPGAIAVERPFDPERFRELVRGLAGGGPGGRRNP
jgi:hypothetical protein